MHGSSQHITLAAIVIVHMSMCLEDCSSVSVREEVLTLTEIQAAHKLYGHQPMKRPQLQLWDESSKAHIIQHENWEYLN
jgi:hypothetical protein